MITAAWRVDDAKLRSFEARMPGSARQMVNQLATETASIIRASWWDRSPAPPGQPPAVVSGALDASITVQHGGSGGRMSSRVSAPAKHAHFDEHGTVRMAARPFMFPAAMMVESRIPDYARDAFTRALG